MMSSDHSMKDEVLATLATQGNVARFVSFSPDVELRFARLDGTTDLTDARELIDVLLSRSAYRMVNVRSFRPESTQGNEFIYGLQTTDDTLAHVRRLARNGFFTIVNETIDVQDGGVSGVVHGNAIEFAPGDTPRAVEKPGIASLPRDLGILLLETVYGFSLELAFPLSKRVEFSIHPLRVGERHGHTLLWEMEESTALPPSPTPGWPNSFSKMVGDKAFGLALGASAGLPVPKTHVLSRRLAPFSFGESTGSGEIWLRTVPNVARPGLFSTRRGWSDPFSLLMQEDPTGEFLAGVIAQEGVNSIHGGAARLRSGGEAVVEGVEGFGDAFMLGEKPPEVLPETVLREVGEMLQQAWDAIGVGGIEWAHDGERVWLLQLHSGRDSGHGQVIVPGTPGREVTFRVADGLERLRQLVNELGGQDVGVVLDGQVGVTSHFGDVLRRAGIPARVGGG